MKRILFIAYFFPPCPSIGSQRPYKLAKYLSVHGWEPIILTPQAAGKRPEGLKVIETQDRDVLGDLKASFRFDPRKGMHEQLGIEVHKNFDYRTIRSKIIRFFKEVIAFPENEIGWYPFAVDSASEVLKNDHVQAIISTSFPVTSHMIAKRLKEQYGIPWVADIRDPWTQNPYWTKYEIVKFFERKLEVRVLSQADILVVVSPLWVDLLKSLHKGARVLCVPNGFDPDDFPGSPINLTRKFTLTYTGQMYNGKRDPGLLFKVVSNLIKEGRIDEELIDIRFFCLEESWLLHEVRRYNLDKVVSFHGYVPREDALKRQRESQLLLLLLWEKDGEEGFCPAKLYEYLGAKRPILAIGGSNGGVVQEILSTTEAGKFASGYEELSSVLLQFYEQYTADLQITSHSNHNIEKYTYYSIAKEYSEILNQLV